MLTKEKQVNQLDTVIKSVEDLQNFQIRGSQLRGNTYTMQWLRQQLEKYFPARVIIPGVEPGLPLTHLGMELYDDPRLIKGILFVGDPTPEGGFKTLQVIVLKELQPPAEPSRPVLEHPEL